MADMFGAPIGISQADRDMAQLAQTASSVLLQQSQVPLNQAHTQLYQAQAAEAQKKAKVQEAIQARMAGLLTGSGGGQPGQPSAEGGEQEDPIKSMVNLAYGIARIRIESGDTSGGVETLGKAATMERLRLFISGKLLLKDSPLPFPNIPSGQLPFNTGNVSFLWPAAGVRCRLREDTCLLSQLYLRSVHIP